MKKSIILSLVLILMPCVTQAVLWSIGTSVPIEIQSKCGSRPWGESKTVLAGKATGVGGGRGESCSIRYKVTNASPGALGVFLKNGWREVNLQSKFLNITIKGWFVMSQS